MSLPIEIREQLLSGYLDDALSSDERARAEQMIRDDPEFAADLEELRQLRADLQSIGQADDDFKLGSGFADRVLDGAIAQARSEGLDDDHPLLRLAEQPSAPRRRRGIDWRIPATLAALAASVAFAIFAYGPSNNPQPIAEDLAPENEAVAEVIPESSDPVVIAEDSSSEPVAPEQIVPEELFEPTLDESSTTDMVADSDGQGSVPEFASDTVETPSPPPASVVQSPTENQLLLGGSPVMVYSIRMTELGKEEDAVTRALTNAQIGATRQRKVTDEIAGFVSEKNNGGSVGATVLYLQAPLKNLDRFYLNLMADEQGVEKVGMTIAFNAPIKRLVERLRAEPTTVRHDGRLLELVSETPAVAQLASELDQLPFDFSRSSSPKLQNDGPDEMGQVLVLVLP